MKPSIKLSVAYLRKRLLYDAESGSLFWLNRSPDQIGGDPSARERICKNWNARFSGKEAFVTLSLKGYLIGVVDRKRLYKHHVIWAMHYGIWPKSMIDHIDGNPLNNHIDNLRTVTRAENQKNLRLQDRNKTGRIGVWYDKRRRAYQAFISHERKRISLGRFKEIDDAIAAREKAEIEYGYHPNHGSAKALP